MLLIGDVRPSTAIWHHDDKHLTALAVWSEKRPGLGEDAEPTLLHHVASRAGILGVYDGLGGAGARSAGRTVDGRQVSNAFVASRLAHLTVQSWFANQVSADPSGQTLREQLGQVLAAARSPVPNKLAGTLRRDLPTTVALIQYRVRRTQVELVVRWAGDSRCLLLTPHSGLQQLSRDDVEGQDALEQIVTDQPMTNLASATGDFEIHERQLTIELPCVLVCATDGFFGYVATPAHFEYVLLDSLREAGGETGGVQHWAGHLLDRVRSYTADDASLALAAFGFGSFRRLRDAFRERWQELDAQHWKPLQNLPDREALVEARLESWWRYRDHYTQFLRTLG